MKTFIRSISLLLAILTVTLFAGCAQVPANTVFSADDLPGKKIGVQLGTTGDIYASDYETPEDGTAASTIVRYKTGAEAVQALVQGKIDCVIIDNEPAKRFVEKNKGLKILDDPFTVEEYAIAIAKENTELKEKINSAIATIKENGTLQAIIDNYIGENRGKNPYVSPENVTRDNGTLVMATNAAFEPYEYYENEQIVGLDVDMAQAIADILGMELTVKNVDFDSIIIEVQQGKADIGVAGMTVTEDRMLSVDFSTTYTTATQVIIVREK